ncbi:MAG: serine/threonine-protein kinase [Gemmatimonadales bacterium]
MRVCPACGAEYGDDAAFCARDRTPLPPAGGGLVGQVLADRYRIERKLGEGGMGEVYLAEHVLMGRPSAVKVMSPSLTRDPEAVGRFNREATNASRISHPNVCAIYDFGLTTDGVLYLAMEYLEGRTLSQALAAGPLPLPVAADILRQCAAGLAAAHELGIVHRDLKPDNVMLVEQRGRETVKLVDFGIAKAGAAAEGQRVTRTGLVVGTPEYMSPEQFTSDPIDGRSDQYSLALLFYRMVTGGLPFRAASAQEAMAKRLTERPEALATIAPGRGFPPALQAVLNRALERRPDARFASVEAFAASLADAVATVAEPTLPRTAVVAPRRRFGPPAIAAGALVVAVAGWGLWQLRPGSMSPAPETPGAPTPFPGTDTGTTHATVPPAPPELPRPDTPSLGSAGTAGTQIDPAQSPPAPPPLTLADLPSMDDIEPGQPNAEATRRALRLALQAEDSPGFTDSVRAEMGLLAGTIYLDQGRRTDARSTVERACRRYELPRCAEFLQVLRGRP